MTTQTPATQTVDFILPDLGEGVHEAEIISWKVKVGDTVNEMDVLAEMETDKALVELPSPYSGTITALHGNEGEIVHVGNPIVSFENAMQGGEAVGGNDVTDNTDTNTDNQNTPATATASEDAGTVVGTMETQPTLGKGGKVMATPAVRRLAKQRNIDLNTIKGTGRGGRITASDVQNATSSTSTVPSSAPVTSPAPEPLSFPPVTVDASGTSERIPFSGIRKKIAESLQRSVKTAVHFTVMDNADVTRLDVIRKQQSAATGESISFLPFIIQAVCRALRKYPKLNAIVDDAASEILIKGVINMGIAVDTEHGLMVPNIPNADQLPILKLAREIASIAEQCRKRTIPLERLKGGTFTLSNVGSYGGSFATPILNYPEVGILAIGRARETVMAKNGAIYIGKQMPLSMSCDHRVVDGVVATQLVSEVSRLLANPEILLQPAG